MQNFFFCEKQPFSRHLCFTPKKTNPLRSFQNKKTAKGTAVCQFSPQMLASQNPQKPKKKPPGYSFTRSLGMLVSSSNLSPITDTEWGTNFRSWLTHDIPSGNVKHLLENQPVADIDDVPSYKPTVPGDSSMFAFRRVNVKNHPYWKLLKWLMTISHLTTEMHLQVCTSPEMEIYSTSKGVEAIVRKDMLILWIKHGTLIDTNIGHVFEAVWTIWG